MPINIAIDGPAGAGKSSAAKILAKKLSFIYMDTGALYRTVGLYCLDNGVTDFKDSEKVESLLPDINIAIRFIDGRQHVFLNGEDVSGKIRTERISMAASAVSALLPVRTFLLNLQRDIAAETNLIMDGRDIGSVILPNADVKIFLTASAESRAKRRTDELIAKGEAADFNEVLKQIIERDTNDSTRAISPLIKAEDAVLLDNSEMNLEETVEEMLSLIRKKVNIDV